MLKMWLDPRGGRGQKITPNVAQAVFDEAKALGQRVAVHPRDHIDVETAVHGGAYALVHLARDREMTDEIIAEIVAKGIYLTPTLSMAERNDYGGAVPAWFEEPALAALLEASVKPEGLAPIRASFVNRSAADAEQARKSYAYLHNSVRKLNAAGARIVLGGDTGLPEHYFGLAEHRELELLVAAGEKLPAGTASQPMSSAGAATLATMPSTTTSVLNQSPS
jgi:hypothetical protein